MKPMDDWLAKRELGALLASSTDPLATEALRFALRAIEDRRALADTLIGVAPTIPSLNALRAAKSHMDGEE